MPYQATDLVSPSRRSQLRSWMAAATDTQSSCAFTLGVGLPPKPTFLRAFHA